MHQYLLNSSRVADTVLGIKSVHKKDKVPVLMELTLYWKEACLFCLVCQALRCTAVKNEIG